MPRPRSNSNDCTVCNGDLRVLGRYSERSLRCKRCVNRKHVAARKARVLAGLCGCGRSLSTRWFCSDCAAKNRQWHNDRNASLRVQVLAAYGSVCSCCGEAESAFLTIDHVIPYSQGGGPRGPRSGAYLYAWLKRNGYPDGFRVLCMNCNGVRAQRGFCPHEAALGFVTFPFGGHEHVAISMTSKFAEVMGSVVGYCKLLGQDINDFMRPVLEEFVRKAAKEVEARENSKESVAEQKVEW